MEDKRKLNHSEAARLGGIALSNKYKELYLQNPKKCKYCGNDILYSKRHNDCCCKECSYKLRGLLLSSGKNNELQDNLYCQYCNKQCKNLNSLKQHEIRCKENPNHKESSFIEYNKIAWNKGLTKETDERVAKGAKTFNDKLASGEIIFKGTPHTEEFKKLASINAKKNKLGGWHSSQHIKYNGVRLDSSYELHVAKSLDENNIKWIRQPYFLWIDKNNNEHRYYPDFYLSEYNVYLDPKNDWLITNINSRLGISDVEKIHIVEKQNNIKILILTKDELDWNIIKNKIIGVKDIGSSPNRAEASSQTSK